MKVTPRLYRIAVIFILWLPVMAELAWSVHSEHFMYLDAKGNITQLARKSAQAEARLIALRLAHQFNDLSFVAVGLIGPKPSQALNAQSEQVLQNFVAQHKELFALGAQSADGSHVIWSNDGQTVMPIAPGTAFTPVQNQPEFLLGEDTFADHAGRRLISMAYRMKDMRGQVLYLVGSLYRVDDLLANTELSPFALAVRDLRDGSLLGVWEQGRITYPQSAPKTTVSVSVPGMPLAVQASWPEGQVWKLYEDQGLMNRMAARAVILIVLSVAAIMIGLLMRKREQQAIQIARLSAFNAMLAQVNQTIAEAQDERVLFQNVCGLAVKYTEIALAWIGRPDLTGAFQFLAAAGPEQGYLKEVVFSADPVIAEGQEATGRAWREGQAYFNAGVAETPPPQPWHDRALRFGLQANACLPILRGGQVSDVMTLYAREREFFDKELQDLLCELSENISRGLDHIDLVHREQEASAFNIALLESLTAGVNVIRYPDRVIERVNTRFLQLVGASSFEEIQQHRAREFYPDRDTYLRVKSFAEDVLRDGYGMFRDVPCLRLDGQAIYVDLSGRRLDGQDGRHRIVWTFVEVTERHEKEAAIRNLSAMRATLLTNTVAGIDLVRYPERVFVEANQGFLNIMGYASADEIIGRKTSELYATDAENQRMAALAQKVLSEGSAGLRDLAVRRKDGQLVYLDIQGRRLDEGDPEHPVVVWTSVDVTERRHLTYELTRQAQFDELTSLPNRRALDEHLLAAIAKARRHGTLLAVGMLDLDDFKPVNDQFGHEAGDELLRQLAERLQKSLRASDFIARLGGDEFVVVIEDLEASLSIDQLGIVLERLHKEVEFPFDLGEERSVEVDMSMGLALYPMEAEEPDELLRMADAAMYQAKAHKADRTQWWSLRSTMGEAVATETSVDPFGEESTRLLASIEKQLSSVITEFIEPFYAGLAQKPEQATIFACLSPEEVATLKTHLKNQLRFLLSPGATENAIAQSASQLGRAHALTGVSGIWMSRSMAQYRDLLYRRLGAMPHTIRNQYRLLQVVDARLQVHAQAVFDAMQTLEDTYNAYLARPLPESDAIWTSFCQTELDALGALPGIRACELLRPDANGAFAIEFSAGAVAEAIGRISREPGLQPQLDVRLQSGHGCISQAWRTGTIQSTDAHALDDRAQAWHAAFKDLGIRSMVAIPVSSKDGIERVLAIQGAYPHQFAALWARTFTESLQTHWGRIAQMARSHVLLMSQEAAAAYRQHLYSGGLAMFVQPIVDLRAGSVVKAEALARLKMPDGKIIVPDIFLPALRDADLDALFRMGLNQALEHLRAWEREGLSIGLSLNLEPSTLVHPDCASWVEDALHRHAVAPHRLTLELLETQDFAETRKDNAIQNLLRTGVRLAIDDLGSGYSSFRRLASCAFDIIKLDKSLMGEIARDPIKILSLIRTIVQIGRDLELEVVVEGMETTAEIEAAGIIGAQYGQGYGIASPLPGADLPAWVSTQAWQAVDRRALHSYLGALAYHWKFRNHIGNVRAMYHADCLLTDFLRERGSLNSEPERWHRQFHEAEENSRSRKEASRRLIEWLIEQVQQEAREAAYPATTRSQYLPMDRLRA